MRSKQCGPSNDILTLFAAIVFVNDINKHLPALLNNLLPLLFFTNLRGLLDFLCLNLRGDDWRTRGHCNRHEVLDQQLPLLLVLVNVWHHIEQEECNRVDCADDSEDVAGLSPSVEVVLADNPVDDRAQQWCCYGAHGIE